MKYLSVKAFDNAQNAEDQKICGTLMKEISRVSETYKRSWYAVALHITLAT